MAFNAEIDAEINQLTKSLTEQLDTSVERMKHEGSSSPSLHEQATSAREAVQPQKTPAAAPSIERM